MRRIWTALQCAAALLAWLCHRHQIGNRHTCYRGADGFVWFECVDCGLPVRTRVVDGTRELPSPDAEAEMACVRLEQRHADALMATRKVAGVAARREGPGLKGVARHG